MRKFFFFCILTLGIFLSSCESETLPKISTKDLESPHSSISLSSSTLGAVKGTISSEEISDRIGIVIYLGQIIEDSNGQSVAILNTETAPVANYDSTSGEFSFLDIQPGNYSLIIHEVVFGGKAYVDELGNIKVISVNQGSVTDVGIVKFDGF